MTKKQKPIKSKLSKFGEKFLTVSEVAKDLSTLEEEVSEANPANAVRGGIITFEKPEKEFPETPNSGKELPETPNSGKELNVVCKDSVLKNEERSDGFSKSFVIDYDHHFLNDGIATTIEGVWDLSMVGNERFAVERAFQILSGGPEVTLNNIDETIVILERDNGQCCALLVQCKS